MRKNEKWQHCMAVSGTYVLDDTAVPTTVDNTYYITDIVIGLSTVIYWQHFYVTT
jgi:hypothetical protein